MTDRDILDLATKYASIRLKKAKRYAELHPNNEEAKNIFAHWQSVTSELIRRQK